MNIVLGVFLCIVALISTPLLLVLNRTAKNIFKLEGSIIIFNNVFAVLFLLSGTGAFTIGILIAFGVVG